jgi:hypothetical protein
MAIDIRAMQVKLEKLNNKGKSSSDSGFWKPEDGQHEIRVLPTPDGDPFKEFWFHYNLGSQSVMCPKRNFGESCPVCEFATKLFKSGEADSVSAAKELFVRQRFLSPILIRGSEKEGVKVWSYSKNVYEELLKTVLDPDFGDITDPEAGFDLKVDKGKKNNARYSTMTVKPKPKATQMCKGLNSQECKELLDSVPDLSTIFTRLSTAEVQAALDKHLAEPDEASVGVERGGGVENAVDAALRELDL